MVTYREFILLFNTEIYFDDIRSKCTPRFNVKGLLIGITLDSVLIRERNEFTSWFPINSNFITWHI